MSVPHAAVLTDQSSGHDKRTYACMLELLKLNDLGLGLGFKILFDL